jgi:hypothetical protein
MCFGQAARHISRTRQKVDRLSFAVRCVYSVGLDWMRPSMRIRGCLSRHLGAIALFERRRLDGEIL